MSLHYNGDKSYLHENKTEIWKSKAHSKIPWYGFFFRKCIKYFTKYETSKTSLKCTVYDFSVDQSAFEKEDTSRINDYLMGKNNIRCFDLLSKGLLC